MRNSGVSHALAALVWLLPELALAQKVGNSRTSEASDASPAPAAPRADRGSAAGSSSAATGPANALYPGVVADPLGQRDPNASLPSSSRPFLGQGQDNFDFTARENSVVTGGPNATAVLAEETQNPDTPELHLVQEHDNLWNLSEGYFKNPWQWPKIWQQNPQIKDPHWIYPGDQVRLRASSEAGRAKSLKLSGDGSGGFIDQRSVVAPGTVFLRNYGFIGDADRDTWGGLVGAREDRSLLSEGTHVYLQMRPGVALRLKQLLTLFEPLRRPDTPPGARRPSGEIVAVRGTVRIEAWNPETRIARAEVIESLDAIERGMRVGPVGRRYDVVSPRPSRANVRAFILTSFYPHVHFSGEQLVFLDRGSEDGLHPGNRLVVLRQGDAWRKSLDTAPSSARERLRVESTRFVDAERVPLLGDQAQFPVETVGELRVLRTEKQSSIALVTRASRELRAGDQAVAEAGK